MFNLMDNKVLYPNKSETYILKSLIILDSILYTFSE